MVQYFLRRLFALIPVLFLISIFVFLFVHALPGDPARVLAGDNATLEEVEIVRRALNLDAPLHQQYLDFMGNILHGNLGVSLRTGEQVSTMIGRAFMPTVWLALCSLGWSVLFGLISGVISAVKRGSVGDHVGMFAAVSGISMPPFWLGLLLMQFFSVQLGWFGTSGFDKGLTEKIVIWKHALRNALIPVVTMAGLQFGFLLGGSIVIERVFRWPGMGSLLLDAISFRDYAVVQAEIMIFSLEFLLINLLVDVLYALINPKIRYS